MIILTFLQKQTQPKKPFPYTGLILIDVKAKQKTHSVELTVKIAVEVVVAVVAGLVKKKFT